MKKEVVISNKRDKSSKVHFEDLKNEADKKPLPKKSPQELTANNLWDSNWLKEKYPKRFDSYYYTDDDMRNTLDEEFRSMYGYTGKL